MDAIIRQKTGTTKIRWERAAQCKAFDSIRDQVVASTKRESEIKQRRRALREQLIPAK